MLKEAFMHSICTRKLLVFTLLAPMLFSLSARAQSTQYKRPSKSTKKTAVGKKGGSAKAKESKGQKGKKDYKVDISDIEKKYWAPKDTDFSVVQSRTYSKTKRYAVSLTMGKMINDSFSDGLNYNVSANYFLSERSGIEFSYMTSNLGDNATVKAFLNDVAGTGGVKPDHNKITSFYGVSYNWVPFYAKMSVLGKRIIYFDMAISPGLGMLNYDQQRKTMGSRSKSALAYTLDITQYFFLNKNWVIRADIKNKWYSEEVVKFSTTSFGDEGSHLRDEFVNNQTFLIGVTYYFN